jgi:hypothetical protein
VAGLSERISQRHGLFVALSSRAVVERFRHDILGSAIIMVIGSTGDAEKPAFS